VRTEILTAQESTKPTAVPLIPGRDFPDAWLDSIHIGLTDPRSKALCEALVAAVYGHSLNHAEAAQAPVVADKTIDATRNDRMFDMVLAMCTPGHECG